LCNSNTASQPAQPSNANANPVYEPNLAISPQGSLSNLSQVTSEVFERYQEGQLADPDNPLEGRVSLLARSPPPLDLNDTLDPINQMVEEIGR
jgi:hypothetical protein